MLGAGAGNKNYKFKEGFKMTNFSIRHGWGCRSSSKAKIFILAASALGLALQSSSATQADSTSVVLVSKTAGATPFIRFLNFKVTPVGSVKSIQFSINPKPGSVTRPISGTYSATYLKTRGFLDSAGNVKVPVWGLYDGVTNDVTLTYLFQDQSTKQIASSISTSTFNDPCKYKQRIDVQKRTGFTNLSYDYMLLKNMCSNFSPAFMDTDGSLRWVGTAGVSNTASIFIYNGVYIGSGPQLLRMELDGAVEVVGDYSNIGVKDFHHNIDPGKVGLLVEVDTTTDFESVILEVNPQFGGVRKIWNMAEIISRAMRAGGDDPSGFVLVGKDWFHNNAATYRASDDSVLISSRENFVIALDYKTSAIKWILGDTSKHWYQYPSLRKYALSVTPGGVAPIGQHALSITYSDQLLLFDDGLQSFTEIPPGNSRKYAVPRKYTLDLRNNTVTQVYSYHRSIVSEICSSVYEDAPNNYLVDYAVAGGFMSGNTMAEIVGLAPTGARVFDYAYPTHFCDEIFNAFPIHLEDLSF
jgi:arylsulfate sulfotransferase